MKKIYKNQTALRFEIHCGVNITGCLERKIKYKKPGSSIINEWVASSSNDIAGHIYYDISLPSELDVTGKWIFWSWIKFTDERVAAGEPETYEIFEEGSL